ncbi:MAG: DoxX family protein [Acidobacteria bacterium]|nr:DoxX family protein [Acidobacteriota bacterium]
MLNFLARFKDHTLAALRIMAGFMFMLHGAQKLFGFLLREGGSTAELFSRTGFAGVLEFFGGLAILLGLFTQPVAFVLSGQMAVAYFMAHFPRSFWPIENRGELAVLYCFVFLFLATSGGGKCSLPQLIRKK